MNWPPLVPIAPGTLVAWRRLSAALEEYSPPCVAEPQLWYSSRASDTEAAMGRCHGCKAFVACGGYAELAGEAAGIWAGIDRSQVASDGNAAA